MAETIPEKDLTNFNITGYWSSSICMYDMPMAYFSPDGIYELREKEKNKIPNLVMKYSVDTEKGIITIDGKKAFDIVSENSILDIAMNFNNKCDISESAATYNKLNEVLQNKKSKNLKNSKKYVLSSKTISGWGQIPDGIIFKLQPDGVKKLNKMITTEKGKFIAFYAADILIDVVPMDKPLQKDELYFRVTNEMSQKITDTLKAEVRK